MSIKKKTVDKSVMTLAVLGSLVFLNILGIAAFGRLDLTRNKEFTLSDATRDTLKGLEDPVTIRAYFTAQLPPPYSTHSQYVEDLLEEYYNAAPDKVRYEFVDPISEETSEDKAKKKELKRDVFGNVVREATDVERELQSLGIPPVEVRVNEDDKIEVKRAYMGIVVKYGDETDTIPVVQDTKTLEYDLTTMIRKIARQEIPKIAIINGHGEPSLQQGLGRLNEVFAQLYEVVEVGATDIPEDADAVLIVGPETTYSDEELRAVDAFVMSGRSAAFLIDPVKVEMQTLQSTDTNHGLGPLLEGYGVKLGEGLVIDVESAPINVTRQVGMMRLQQPVQYPYMLLPQALDPDHALTRGLAQVIFPFAVPVEFVDRTMPGVDKNVLVKSSEESTLVKPPYNFDPMQKWTREQFTDPKAHNIVVSLKGEIPSAFNPENKAGEARVLVVGTGGFVTDQFLSAGNQAFALNLLDWLVLDSALLDIRARGLTAAPLEELEDGTRTTVKYANVFGLPALFVLFGIFRWRRRESRRARASL